MWKGFMALLVTSMYHVTGGHDSIVCMPWQSNSNHPLTLSCSTGEVLAIRTAFYNWSPTSPSSCGTQQIYTEASVGCLFLQSAETTDLRTTCNNRTVCEVVVQYIDASLHCSDLGLRHIFFHVTYDCLTTDGLEDDESATLIPQSSSEPTSSSGPVFLKSDGYPAYNTRMYNSWQVCVLDLDQGVSARLDVLDLSTESNDDQHAYFVHAAGQFLWATPGGTFTPIQVTSRTLIWFKPNYGDQASVRFWMHITAEPSSQSDGLTLTCGTHYLWTSLEDLVYSTPYVTGAQGAGLPYSTPRYDAEEEVIYVSGAMDENMPLPTHSPDDHTPSVSPMARSSSMGTRLGASVPIGAFLVSRLFLRMAA